GTTVPVTDNNRTLAVEANDRMAAGGQRVMVVAQRDLEPARFDPNADLIDLVRDLTLLAMVGIVETRRDRKRRRRSRSAAGPVSGYG
ncbi:MAG: hypothetical protein ACM3ZF_10430, partial [Mycobacterium leprae]